MEKKCFKCEMIKPLSEYYKHPQTADGHLNKCKDCTKNDSKSHRSKSRQDPKWIESEKERHRDKYHRLRYKEKYKRTKEQKKLATDKHKEKYPEKFKARILCQKMNPKTEGNHLHHWSYREEHAKDVIELDPKTHAFLHRYINYDQEKMMYRVSSNIHGWVFGELLDTKKKHEMFLRSCIMQRET